MKNHKPKRDEQWQITKQGRSLVALILLSAGLLGSVAALLVVIILWLFTH